MPSPSPQHRFNIHRRHHITQGMERQLILHPSFPDLFSESQIFTTSFFQSTASYLSIATSPNL
ncbi:hypothetical protein HMPREF3038_01382 [Akkermansia sp. KLE1797]|nr:hypothetical protein HMPREF3038_01382 [Akkermansia sp. KLE1797]